MIMHAAVSDTPEKQETIQPADASIRVLVVEPESMRRKCAQRQLQPFARPNILRKLHFAQTLADAWQEISRMECPYDCVLFGQDYSLPEFGDNALLKAILRPGMDAIESMAYTAVEKNPTVKCLLCIHDNVTIRASQARVGRIYRIKAAEHSYAGAWDSQAEQLIRGASTTQPVLDYVKGLRFLGFFDNSRLASE